jgi:hypothetical protein
MMHIICAILIFQENPTAFNQRPEDQGDTRQDADDFGGSS